MSNQTHLTTDQVTKHAWILWDGRAEFQDTDDCNVLEFSGTTRKELASSLKFWAGHDGVLAEYVRHDDGAALTDERIIGHLREGTASLMEKCSRE